MPLIRGMFRVVRVNKFSGSLRHGAMIRLESTQADSMMFGAQLDLMTTDPQTMSDFDLDAEVAVEAMATGRKY